jgi:TonB-linked SusC/RagA family outer membrane protein
MRKALCCCRKAEFNFHSFTKGDGLQKLLRIMRLTVILLTAACLSAAARGYTQGISLNMKNTPLDKVFAAIEKQTGYYFTYTREILQGTRNVDVDVQNAAIKDVMNICVKGQPVIYEILEKAIVIRRRGERLTKDIDLNSIGDVPNVPIDVHGRVVNEKGEPVAGATVTVKGTQNATSTNDNGEFVLKGVEGNATLVVSGVNVQGMEVAVGGKNIISITAQTRTTSGEEVRIEVQTGYQRVSKERFIGSVVTVDSALFHRELSRDVLSRLDGIAGGVLFKKNGGQNIMIRGISTLDSRSSFEPLIILDDFPYNGKIENINPNDVESVTILRDAVAASVWGTRAGNGVIVITTKKAKYNQALQMSYGYNIRVQEKPNLFYVPLINTSDFIDVQQFLFGKGFYDANLNNTITYPYLPEVVEILEKQRSGKISAIEANSQIEGLRSIDVRNDFKKYLTRKAVSQQHYLSVGGGTNVLRYNLSAGYDHDLSSAKGDGEKGDNRYTISTDASFKPFRALELTAGINFSQSERTIGIVRSSVDASPYAQLADAFGNPLALAKTYRNGYTDTAGRGLLLDWKYRPLEEVGLAGNFDRTTYYNLNVGANIRITSWLNSNIKFQYGRQTAAQRNDKSVQSFEVRDLINRYSQISGTTLTQRIPVGDILDLTNTELRNYNIRGQLNFTRNFNRNHEVIALVAAEVGDSKSNSNTNRLYGFDDASGTYYSQLDYITLARLYTGGSDRIPSGVIYDNGTLNRVVSVLGNVSYSFKQRYSVYASARRDGSNKFGENTNARWKPLWSVGAGWNISKEDFLSLKWLSSLRLRASYGYTGNPPGINPPGSVGMISYNGISVFTNLPFGGAGPSNSGLKWEEVGIFNVGLDFAINNNRISGSIEWFQKKCRDLIAQVASDPAFGLGVGTYTTTQNIANLKGNGFDISVQTQNLTDKLQWTTTFNLSHSQTIVTKYFENFIRTPVGLGINPHKGELAWGVYSYRWAGLDPTTGDPQGYLGKIVSKDYQSISLDSFQNQVYSGSSIPLYFGNILNSFSWKGFSLSFNIAFRFQYYLRKATVNYDIGFNSFSNTIHEDYYNRWQKPGDEMYTTVPSLTYPSNPDRDRFYQYSEVNVVRGDNIRLQDVRIGFPALDKNKNHWIPAKTIQFYFYPSNINVLLWKKNKSGLDPDYLANTFSQPPPISWGVGININF